MIKRYLLLFTCVLLNSSLIAQESIDYRFHWFSIPVAKLSFTFDQSISSSKRVDFDISTEGPLKLYRNYTSKGYINKSNKDYWHYYLRGYDRGQPEKKSIYYFYDKEPVINEFIDDQGTKPIKIDPILDRNTIDPFSVLIETIKQLNQKQKCSKALSIMDGKRRYWVSLNDVDDLSLNSKISLRSAGNIYQCEIIVHTSQEPDKNTSRNIWPFNNGQKVINIWFSEDLNYRPVRIQVQTPIGKIIGNIIN